jgi:predicted permease
MFKFLFPKVSKTDVKEALAWRQWQVYALFMVAVCFSSWLVTIHEAKRDVSTLAAVVFVFVALFGNYLLLRITSNVLMQERLEKEALLPIDVY